MIACITDFGHRDNFVGVVKGVIAGINPGVRVIDICHSVNPFSITNAQFMLHSSYTYFPRGTVFYVVVDPGVGSQRKGLIAVSKDYTFVLPDNGILSAVESEPGDCAVYAIDEENYSCVSPTFHGRDIFAPVAAQLASGKKPDELGTGFEQWHRMPFPVYRVLEKVVEAEVLHSDHFGNVTLSIPCEVVKLEQGRRYRLRINDRKISALACTTFSDLVTGEAGIHEGSSGFLEVIMNRRALQAEFNISLEDRAFLHLEG